MKEVNLAITGCAGRMGQALLTCLSDTKGVRVSGGLVPAKSPYKGKDLGLICGQKPLGITATDNIAEALNGADGVIDFTTPELTTSLVKMAVKAKIFCIIGTTGLSTAQEKVMHQAAKKVLIVKSGNMSLGVHLLARLTRIAATILSPNTWDSEIMELHHRLKKDAPSGTAILLGKAVAQGRHQRWSQKAVFQRHGSNVKRNQGEIGFASMRAGNAVGEHTVLFAGEDEQVVLTHKAQNRAIYAKGALTAALWAARQTQPGKKQQGKQGQTQGLYGMEQVLEDLYG